MIRRLTFAASATAAVTLVAGGAAASTPPAGDSPAPIGPHVVVHAMGETEVPADPQRVVVLDSSFLDSAVALGLTPVGATEGFAGGGLPGYLPADVLEAVEIVGETNAPQLESIAALEPDLIIGAKVRHEGLYDELSQIAPTVFSESSGGNWTEQVLLTGEAIGRPDDAQALLDAFDERAAEVGEAIGASELTATIVRFLPDETRLYGPGSFSGSVLTAVGFDLGDKDWNEYSMALISTEQIELVDADVVFATTYGSGETTRPQFEGLWETLDAVENRRQFDVEDAVWMTGIGVLGANLILDDLETMLGDAAATTAPATTG
ncbi:ABC transporter substrate-binding protein [Desertimonas flava]|uniref:ABC transporter substrate-binding protein n=1 Tax=Desertimonas flava TaxID=2064846 RepID=UPI001878356B|nr:iron-siderophore ABC transporter substrate-binding protein [Desertimonas flava]